MKTLKTLFLMAAVTLTLSASAANPVKINLWPDGAPVENGFDPKNERIEDGYKLMDVANAELWIYPAKNPNGVCIMLTPGGGYQCLVIEKEGTMFANWLSAQGFTCAVLKYRMPNGHKEIPLMDAERAMEILRAKASEYHYNPNKIGVMGGSAGGHFAAMLSTLYSSPATRPDFQILMYPVIYVDITNSLSHKNSAKRLLGANPTEDDYKKFCLQNQVTPMTPPAFVILSCDDKVVDPLNSLEYVKALGKNNVPCSLHIYPAGGHGYGNLDTNPFKLEFQSELLRFLNEQVK